MQCIPQLCPCCSIHEPDGRATNSNARVLYTCIVHLCILLHVLDGGLYQHNKPNFLLRMLDCQSGLRPYSIHHHGRISPLACETQKPHSFMFVLDFPPFVLFKLWDFHNLNRTSPVLAWSAHIFVAQQRYVVRNTSRKQHFSVRGGLSLALTLYSIVTTCLEMT